MKKQIEVELKFKRFQIKVINVGCNEFYWRDKDFQIYLQGLYLLDKDYQKLKSK